ncbi:hypothetical protein NPIL_156961 [Nephila pilipes]|uniref:Uncharacterized protein n=1 Tax=Nephila pilipes TaxID=299642 RepID=A0A8X6NS66_NEPPI|nr:hypothetical protein NPIL_156961 [Nephila pilipes]
MSGFRLSGLYSFLDVFPLVKWERGQLHTPISAHGMVLQRSCGERGMRRMTKCFLINHSRFGHPNVLRNNLVRHKGLVQKFSIQDFVLLKFICE